jgi:hypothetical protein
MAADFGFDVEFHVYRPTVLEEGRTDHEGEGM